MNIIKRGLIGLAMLSLLIAPFSVPATAEAYVSVKGYYKSNGTYVAPYVRSNPNGLKYDNYGYKPSQGLYNKSYGTKGATWDTPTYITDPDYYVGKALYDSNSSGSISSPSKTSVTSKKTTVSAPANAYVLGSYWFCNNGYKQVGESCSKVVAPANAYVSGSYWFCNSGYKQVGNSCEKVIAPANAYVSGSYWFCNNGYKEVGNTCQKVVAPENAYVSGSYWFCKNGYKEVGNSCEKVIAPANAYVSGSYWFCNSGYREVGNKCIKT